MKYFHKSTSQTGTSSWNPPTATNEEAARCTSEEINGADGETSNNECQNIIV